MTQEGSPAVFKRADAERKRRVRNKPLDAGSLIDAAFKKQITVIEKGKTKRVTVFAVIFKLLWTKEMSGDRRALMVRTKYQTFAQKQQPERRPEIIVIGGLPNRLPEEDPTRDGRFSRILQAT